MDGLRIAHRAMSVTIAVMESTGPAARATPIIIPCGARTSVHPLAAAVRTWVAHPIGIVHALILSVTIKPDGPALECVAPVNNAKLAMMASTGRVARVTQRCIPAMNQDRVTVIPIAVPMDGICSWAI